MSKRQQHGAARKNQKRCVESRDDDDETSINVPAELGYLYMSLKEN